MGGSKNYLPEGGFIQKEYKHIGTTQNGINIIVKKSNNKSSTPMYSNTPYTMYARLDNTHGDINQISVYKQGAEHRAKSKDIDIGHEHSNTDDKRRYKQKDMHVHEYDKNGVRSNNARKPSKKEKRLLMIAKYGRMNIT